VILKPIVVTKDNLKATVIKDGFIKPSDLCTGSAAAACKSAGIA
jgi:D-xylose transport system substrate-binding protein